MWNVKPLGLYNSDKRLQKLQQAFMSSADKRRSFLYFERMSIEFVACFLHLARQRAEMKHQIALADSVCTEVAWKDWSKQR